MKVEWPSLIIGGLVATISGLAIAWASPILQQSQKPDPIRFAHQSSSIAIVEPENDSRDGGQYLTVTTITNMDNVVKNLKISLLFSNENAQITKVSTDGVGVLLNTPLNKNSIDSEGVMRIDYEEFRGFAEHTIFIWSTRKLFLVDENANRDDVIFSSMNQTIAREKQRSGDWSYQLARILSVVSLLAGLAFMIWSVYLSRNKRNQPDKETDA